MQTRPTFFLDASLRIADIAYPFFDNSPDGTTIPQRKPQQTGSKRGMTQQQPLRATLAALLCGDAMSQATPLPVFVLLIRISV